MLDVVAILSFVVLFSLSVFYVYGCENLKGKRK